jgi:hypothetical protein
MAKVNFIGGLLLTMLNHDHPELKAERYVVFVDEARRYVDCTDGVCELLGYSRDELLQKRIEDISYDVRSVSPLFAEFVEAGQMAGTFILEKKTKTPAFIKYRAYAFEDGCKAAVWEPLKDWREAYLSALAEVDPGKLKQKVDAARTAIQQAKAVSPNAGDLQAMQDAMSTLNILTSRDRS